jgi:hydrogenase nickel incorporation protein HypA/HybF
MHELSIALSILDIVTAEAERCGAVVKAVHLRLGPLAGVISEALLSSWELARESSSFPTARLVIENVPLIVWCPTCNSEQPAESMQHLCCSICNTPTPDVITGRELDVVAMEISDESANASGGSSPESLEAK